jgi:ribonuclease P protein component
MESSKLNLNKDFRRLYGRGKNFVHPLLVTYVMKNKRGEVRYGITAGKKVGCAVMRNRARRVIQAAFVECLKSVDCDGADIVFVARSRTPFCKSQDVMNAMLQHFKISGLIKGDSE